MINKEYVIIDSNVIYIAEFSSNREAMEQEYGGAISDDEILACVKALKRTMELGGDCILVLDCDEEILNEYNKKMRRNYSSISEKFIIWCKNNQYTKIYRTKITKKGDSYKEFPNHPGLKDFDNDDKKFIAVAKSAHSKNPTILEATDVEWWNKKDVLKQANISVKFLCENYMKVMTQP